MFFDVKNNAGTGGIVPLYAARVEHLNPARSLRVECLACGHRAELPVTAVTNLLPGWFKVVDIYHVLRCENCLRKGEANVDAGDALGWTNEPPSRVIYNVQATKRASGGSWPLAILRRFAAPCWCG